MQRACFYLRLYPGTEDEYDRRHAAIWPEQQAAIRDAGIRNMTGFRRGTDVWYYAECHPDAKSAFKKFGASKANAKWNDFFRPIIAELARPNGERIWFEEIFHANGGGRGRSERGLFALVVHPDRIAEYDQRHAQPWPEMMAALDVAGFHNYSGFRRGSQVVYYGEFYPDMRTAMRTIGATDVNRRWNVSFEGIITTITDQTGDLLTAREVFHQD
ncbi:MAG: L-rhamnose mutarotase [Chloroflexi bacterium]|nr:MAG: L-rhamnose mutarotase [Chloroflexota bacterium]